MKVASELRVAVIVASTGATQWTGLLCDFFTENAETIDESERVLVVKILNQGGVYHFGGGAGPLFWVRATDALLGLDPPDIVAEEAMEASYYADAKRQGLDEISTERYVSARRAADKGDRS